MLPEFKALRRKCRRSKIKIPDEPYFSNADEFVGLQRKFICESFFQSLTLWFDMVLYPIFIFIRVCMQNFSVMYVIALSKTYTLWIEWFRFKELSEKVKTWTHVVRSVSGPWISTNDPDYHVYVYADGMERIKYALKKKSQVS